MSAVPSIDITSPQQFRKLKLTDRWTELKPHYGQQLFFWHPAAIKVNPSGRRSGKTELSKRKAVLQLVKKRDWPAKVLIGAPTWDQVRDIYWADMKALIPPSWIASKSESRMEITMRWGAILRLMSLDRPQRAEGTPWDWLLVDELASCFPGLLELNLLPAMGTLGRTVSADLIGVPDEIGPNQREYEALWEKGLLWPKYPDICSFHWPSSDILEPSKMAQFRATMDPLAYEQEFGGRFVTSGGKAVPRFDVALHVRSDYTQYEPYLPLDWTLDFGSRTAASLICQTYRGRSWVLDEIVLTQDASTEVAADEFLTRCRARGYQLRRVRVFADAAGKTRHSPTGESDYGILEQKLRGFNVEWNQLRAAPAIKDTVNAVRAAVCSTDNQIRLHVNPQCKTLIEDMKTAPWPSKLEDFHCLAAIRYYLYTLAEQMPGAITTGGLSLPNLGASAPPRY